MSSKLRVWFGGALGLLLLVVLARCGTEGPDPTSVDRSGGLAPAAAPQTTDPNPPGWAPGFGILSHDGLPTDLDFEGISAVCGDQVGEFYAGAGVHFSGGDDLLQDNGCLNSFNYPPHSPITVMGPLVGSSNRITVNFDVAQGDVGIRYTTNFPLRMRCFTGLNGGGTLVGTDVAVFPNLDNNPGSVAPPNELLRVTGPGILSCIFRGTAGFYTLDDLFADNVTLEDIPGETCGGQAVTPGVEHTVFNGVHFWVGTSGDDVISTFEGAQDNVIAREGDDLVCTFDLFDFVDGGPGEDEIHGGDGNDFLFGKEDSDHLFGDAGSDRLDGGHTPVPSSLPDIAPDICEGGTGADRFFLCETVIDP